MVKGEIIFTFAIYSQAVNTQEKIPSAQWDRTHKQTIAITNLQLLTSNITLIHMNSSQGDTNIYNTSIKGTSLANVLIKTDYYYCYY